MLDPHRARRLALQALSALDVQGPKAIDLAINFIDDSDEDPQTLKMAKELAISTWHRREQCDELLQRHARHWNLTRLALVDRNILRLAVHELLNLSLSPKIIISEALKLAHEFSSAESPRFINGVIDAVSREIAKETA